MTPSQDFLLKRFEYDSETGIFIKKVSLHKHTDTPGKRTKYGIQIRITYKGKLKTYLAHNLIWKYMTGEEPNKISHYNKDTTDNKWVNLTNTMVEINKPSLPLGIYFKTLKEPSNKINLGSLRTAQRNRWVVKLDGKVIGTYKCPTAAILAKRKYLENVV